MTRDRFLFLAFGVGLLLVVACGEKDNTPVTDGDSDSELERSDGDTADYTDFVELEHKTDGDVECPELEACPPYLCENNVAINCEGTTDGSSDDCLEIHFQRDDCTAKGQVCDIGAHAYCRDPQTDGDADSDHDVECDEPEACCTVECIDNAIHSDCGGGGVDENGCFYSTWKTTPCTDGKICVILNYEESACVLPDGDADDEAEAVEREADSADNCRPGCRDNVAIRCVEGKEVREDCDDFPMPGGGECTADTTLTNPFCSGIDRPDGDADSETPSSRVLLGPDGRPRSVIKCYK